MVERPQSLFVIAQCQRCGRGFITCSVKLDPYIHPQRLHRTRKPCRGRIKYLATPVLLEAFENYGPLLPALSDKAQEKRS